MSFKFTALTAITVSMLFGISSLVFHFGNWDRLASVTAFGFFIGILSAPILEPKKFKHAWLFQILSGALSGMIFGFFFHLDIYSVISCILIGGFIGWIAPFWLKYIQIP